MVCQGKSGSEIIEQRFRSGVGMRLEDAPQCSVRTVFSGFHRCTDFGWMMRIIVDHLCSVVCTLILETAVGSAEGGKAFVDGVFRQLQFIGQCNGSQGVGNVVKSRNHQRVATAQLATADAVEGWVIQLIVGNIGSGIVSSSLVLQCVGDNLTAKTFGHVIVFRRIGIDNQHAVGREQTGKRTERVADVVDILEEIEMVCIHVEDNADFRKEA